MKSLRAAVNESEERLFRYADPNVVQVPDGMMLDIRIEEATRRIVSIATNSTVAGTTVEVLAQFTNHDVQVDLIAPPLDQIDDNTGGGSGVDGLLEGVGGSVFGD